jgi:multiple sugar transport system permease protein
MALARRRNLSHWLVNLVLVLVIVVFGAPFIWIVVLAFDREVGAAWPWPSNPTIANFQALFDGEAIGRALRNSIVVVAAATISAVVLSALAGFGLSRLSWRGAGGVAFGLLLLYTFPLAVTMVPINDLARRLRLDNTYAGVILAQTAVTLPLLIWLMKGYFDAIPRHIQEAAEVDGATRLTALWDVLLPLVRPGLAVTAGLAVLLTWSEVLLVSAIVRGQPMATLSLRFMTGAQGGLDAPVVAALGLLYMIPVLVVFVVIRRALVSGIGAIGQGL